MIRSGIQRPSPRIASGSTDDQVMGRVLEKLTAAPVVKPLLRDANICVDDMLLPIQAGVLAIELTVAIVLDRRVAVPFAIQQTQD